MAAHVRQARSTSAEADVGWTAYQPSLVPHHQQLRCLQHTGHHHGTLLAGPSCTPAARPGVMYLLGKSSKGKQLSIPYPEAQTQLWTPALDTAMHLPATHLPTGCCSTGDPQPHTHWHWRQCTQGLTHNAQQGTPIEPSHTRNTTQRCSWQLSAWLSMKLTAAGRLVKQQTHRQPAKQHSRWATW